MSKCMADNCDIDKPPNGFLCFRHWFMLPFELQEEISCSKIAQAGLGPYFNQSLTEIEPIRELLNRAKVICRDIEREQG